MPRSNFLRRQIERRTLREPEEGFHMTALWNLMIILIPFLLLSAVFSKNAILNIYIPENTAGETDDQRRSDAPPMLPIVTILDDGFVLSHGQKVLAALPKGIDGYPFSALSEKLWSLKQQVPDQEAILLLSEPQIPYEVLIHTMDASREIWIEQAGVRQPVGLFGNLSIGEVGKVTFREVLDGNP